MRDIEIPGGWTEITIQLAGRPLSITLPADADKFLEHLGEDAQPLHVADPYWARLWPTALTMAELVCREEWPKDARALELGCGIGVVGLSALLRGLQVTFSDYIRLAVELACENARRNGLNNCEGKVVDWRHPPRDKYAVVFASDVLYDPKQHIAILNFLDAVLPKDGTCWIGDPGRFHCGAFLRTAEQNGYSVTIRDERGASQSRVTVGEFCLLVVGKAVSGER